MMRLIVTLLAVVAAFGVTPALAQRSATCAPTHWDLVNSNLLEDGTMQAQPARVNRYCLFDGDVQMDEFRVFNDEGQPTFWGVSFYQSGTMGAASHALWIMVGDPGISQLHNILLTDQLGTTTGTGTDARGAFLERSATVHHDNGDYDFYLARSYDDGESWLSPLNVINARFVSHVVPELPGGLVPVMQEGADATNANLEDALFILDGTALVRVRENHGERSIVFASRYWNPDRWREVEWTVSTGDINITESAF
jgi:hypothetical protein